MINMYDCLLFSAAAQFCFMSVLQKELDKVRQHWNTHCICPVHESECPLGRPDTIFFLPSLFGEYTFEMLEAFQETFDVFKLRLSELRF